MTAFLLLACCVLYPAVVTAAAQAIFPRQASGSVIEENGKIRGSSLLGQAFDRPMEHLEYFWGRPSAASTDGATGVIVSAGSNYGPMNASLKDEITQRIAALRAAGVTGPVPVDLVTRSGSGLDPHVSIAAAEVQIPRVAQARGLPEGEVRALVQQHTEGRTLGFLGEPRVNVLACNLALDARKAVPPVASPEERELSRSAPHPSPP